MSPQLQEKFMAEIAPIIEKTITRYVTPQGGEDTQDVIQDALVSACQAAESCERRGQPVIANSVAYYAIRSSRSGRRALSAGRTDAFSPGAQIDGRSVLLSLDAPDDPDDDPDPASPCLHAVLASRHEDPASEATRHLDWGGFVPQLTRQQQTVLTGTAVGDSGIDTAAALNVCPPRVVQVKREIAEQARGYWGNSVLADAGSKPSWRREFEQRRAA